MTNSNFVVCVPTLNPGQFVRPFLEALEQQTIEPRLLVVDSGSRDGSVEIFRAWGAQVWDISYNEFDHGGTRQAFVDACPDVEIFVFLTQDAILAAPDALEHLVASFGDSSVGAAYGRQLPRKSANPIEAHARLVNYQEMSCTKSMRTADADGIKSVFLSNSFSAYRRSALLGVGGFPAPVLLGEDTYVAAKMLSQGWSIHYSAEACAFHSHDLNVIEEFRRYFDTGVFHSKEGWIRGGFGRARGEGLRFAMSELRYLLKVAPHLVPVGLFRSMIKLLAFNLGLRSRWLPFWLKLYCSRDERYWKKVALSLPNKPISLQPGIPVGFAKPGVTESQKKSGS